MKWLQENLAWKVFQIEDSCFNFHLDLHLTIFVGLPTLSGLIVATSAKIGKRRKIYFMHPVLKQQLRGVCKKAADLRPAFFGNELLFSCFLRLLFRVFKISWNILDLFQLKFTCSKQHSNRNTRKKCKIC